MALSGDVWLSIIATFILLSITFSLEWGSKQVISIKSVFLKIKKELDLNITPEIFRVNVQNHIEDYYKRGGVINWGVDLALTAISINCTLFVSWLLDPKRFSLPNVYPAFVEFRDDPDLKVTYGLIFWGESFFILICILIIVVVFKNYCSERIEPSDPLKLSKRLINLFNLNLDDSKLVDYEGFFFNFISHLGGVLALIFAIYLLIFGTVK